MFQDQFCFKLVLKSKTATSFCVKYNIMKNYYCLQGNRDDSDVLMYYTTTGWMMWNWMVSALALGKALETEVGP